MAAKVEYAGSEVGPMPTNKASQLGQRHKRFAPKDSGLAFQGALSVSRFPSHAGAGLPDGRENSVRSEPQVLPIPVAAAQDPDDRLLLH